MGEFHSWEIDMVFDGEEKTWLCPKGDAKKYGNRQQQQQQQRGWGGKTTHDGIETRTLTLTPDPDPHASDI
jgi:hypothetical protein